jgi:2'-5' RNA ligase
MGEILQQRNSTEYEFSCLMALLPQELSKSLAEISESLIMDDELYEPEGESTYGRTTKYHITALYGIRESDCLDRVKLVLSEFPHVSAVLTGVSAFTTNPEFDVIKFTVESPSLMRLNEAMQEEFPDHKDTHGQYIPHVTLAYVKKGLAQDIVDRATLALEEEFTPDEPFEIHFPVHQFELSLNNGTTEIIEV